MPELPEVETTKRGIKPHILHQSVKKVIVREPRLRWPVPSNLACHLNKQTIHTITRRGKYILLLCDNGALILHLGMSGVLRVLPLKTPTVKHDHVDIVFQNQLLLRLNDPRRFGAVLFTTQPWQQHKLIASLGPEPLTHTFHTSYLENALKNRKAPIKTAIMDAHLVVGVGNIYANEALFLSGIHPLTPAGTLHTKQYQTLIQKIKQVLRRAIKNGGTTLKDFRGSDGKPGYFSQKLHVYGRTGMLCMTCSTALIEIRLGGRSTVYCPSCQPL